MHHTHNTMSWGAMSPRMSHNLDREHSGSVVCQLILIQDHLIKKVDALLLPQLAIVNALVCFDNLKNITSLHHKGGHYFRVTQPYLKLSLSPTGNSSSVVCRVRPIKRFYYILHFLQSCSTEYSPPANKPTKMEDGQHSPRLAPLVCSCNLQRVMPGIHSPQGIQCSELKHITSFMLQSQPILRKNHLG